MNVVVITGASSGIGREFAIQLDKMLPKVDEFWVIARRRERLLELEEKLAHKCRILVMDVAKEGQAERLADTLEEYHANVRLLINAAGFGTLGRFEKQELANQIGMIRTNCEALTELTYRVLPYMRKGARIIQLASSAAFLPQPNFAVYAATKSYVLSFSKALGEELKDRRIYVTAVCPGPVKTEFFEIAERGGSVMKIKKYVMTNPERVVRRALADSARKRPESVATLPMQLFEAVCKLIPHRVILGAVRLLQKIGG